MALTRRLQMKAFSFLRMRGRLYAVRAVKVLAAQPKHVQRSAEHLRQVTAQAAVADQACT